MKRHIDALVSHIVFAICLGFIAAVLGRLMDKTGDILSLNNSLALFALCLGCVGFLILAINEAVMIYKLKRKYVTVL